MWKMRCRPPLGRSEALLNALNAKFRQQATCFISLLRWACFYLSSLENMGLFSIILTSMWKMGCRPPLRRVRGILNALNAKFRQQATCFLSSLRWACFFCLHCALKYGRSIILWKLGCRPPLKNVRGILNALNATFRQQATCFLSLLRWACFYLSSLCP